MLACSSYSYSEEVFGSTQNAAANGYNWVMANVLPQQAGLTVNGVFYRYTAVKDTADDFVVNIQNEDAVNGGYIFRETDDWSGLPGRTISKLVPTQNIPIQLWGDGSIETQGTGEVTNASVIYNYQFDPCFDPQTDPTCPGYKDPFELLPISVIDVTDPLDDPFIQDELEKKAKLKDEDQEERDRKKAAKEKRIEKSLEAALGAVNGSLLAALEQSKHDELMLLNVIPPTYYTTIPGGTYNETVQLKDKELPDNSRARRVGLAQQLLHEKLVNSQYEN